MTLHVLTRGANVSLDPTVSRVRVVVGWADDSIDVDASALLLSDERKVRSDEDFVFYNQPVASDGTVQHLGRTAGESGAEERLSIDLEEIDPAVHCVAVTASVADATFGDLGPLTFTVVDESGRPLIGFDISEATSETAFVFGEVYRRDGGWKVRAVGQGWDDGLAGLATDFGVSVADEPAATADDSPDRSATEPTSSVIVESDLGTAGDDLVEVVERPVPESVDSLVPDPPADPLTPTQAPAPDRTTDLSSAPARRGSGVRTRKQKPVVAAPVPRLAGEDTWVPARLFSIYGVGAGEEQEKRATSALLSTMMGVRPFARAVTAHLGAPAGAVETFLEVPFTLGERRVVPDGMVRIARAGKIWTALVEVKTGTGQLRKEQVEAYLDAARDNGYDAVVTISNEIAPGTGEHPVDVDQRKLRSVALFHLSWAEILHEARMVLTHRGVADSMQAWVLHELIRYLEHPRSGATGFDDMGAGWVTVREAVAAGTLRAGDRKVPTVADSWARLVRQLSLRLTAELGVPVTHVLPRRLASDPAARTAAAVEQLASDGTLQATLRVPGAAGALTVVADLRTSRVRVSASIPAPREGGPQRRISWMLRQLQGAPDDTLVDVHYSGAVSDTCERLGDVRESSAGLVSERSGEVVSFELTTVAPLGTKRSGVKGAFIPSVIGTTETFYSTVLQPLRAWVAPAPRLSGEGLAPELATTTSEAED